MRPRLDTANWVASMLLTIVTLVVFGSLQNYGPESAIRKFHLGVAERKRELIDESTIQRSNSLATQRLVGRVADLTVLRGADYHFLGLNRDGNEAAAIVVYTFPNGNRTPMIWVVIKDRGVWRIDSERTLYAVQRFLSI